MRLKSTAIKKYETVSCKKNKWFLEKCQPLYNKLVYDVIQPLNDINDNKKSVVQIKSKDSYLKIIKECEQFIAINKPYFI